MWEAILKFTTIEHLTAVWAIGSITVPLLRMIMKPAPDSVADKLVGVVEGLFIDLSKIIKTLTGDPPPKSSLPPEAGK